MAKRDLHVNSLGRYGKQSEKLILEEHGHCEVPAGCGGVVLRWRHAESGLLFLVHVYAAGTFKFYLDGGEILTGRPLISFGRHVIGMTAEGIDAGHAVLALAATHDEEEHGRPKVSQRSGRKLAILSAVDGSWKYSTTEPGTDGWMKPGFDDATWKEMVARAPAKGDAMSGYRIEQLQQAKAAFLGIAEKGTRVWVRKEFTVEEMG